jgi:hypothetical protein
MYAFTWAGCPSSATSLRVNARSGGQLRCSPCKTIVAPAANSRSTMAESTWSATWAPNPPEAVNRPAASTSPSLASRTNGVRSARSVSSSSAAAGLNRSEKSAGSDAAGENNGRSPQ